MTEPHPGEAAARQVPPGRPDEQGPDPARRPAARERYMPMLLERMARGELKTAHLATHPMPLDEGPRGYDLFKNKKDGCVRAVFQP